MSPFSTRVAWSSLPSRLLCGRTVSNALLATILLLIVVQSLPAVPGRIRQKFQPVVLLLGFEQDQWTMFTPDPDRQNHRLSAIVFYDDGSQRTWQPPDWYTQSRWERFLSHRQSKFAENICNPGYLLALSGTAQWVAGEVAKQPDAPTAKAVRVEFWVADAKIPDAHYFPWPSVLERSPFEDRWNFGEVQLAEQEPQ